MKETKCYEFEVNGMHCAACELLIEDKLKEDKTVKSVSANLNSKKVKVEVESNDSYDQIAKNLTKLVDKDGYSLIGGAEVTVKENNWEEFFYLS